MPYHYNGSHIDPGVPFMARQWRWPNEAWIGVRVFKADTLYRSFWIYLDSAVQNAALSTAAAVAIAAVFM